MARPRKNNADWFPHDATMRNNPKIRAVRSKFGNEGYAVWCYLLETLTDADGFELEWSELNQELLAGDFGVSTVETLENMVFYFARLQLVVLEAGKLACPNLKKRLQPVFDNREKASKHYQNRVSTVEMGVSTVEMGVSTVEMTQSRVEYKESILSSSSSSSAQARDFFEKNGTAETVCPPVAPPPPPESVIVGLLGSVGGKIVDDFSRYADRIAADDGEISALCLRSKIPDKPLLLDYLAAFVDFKQRNGDPPPGRFEHFRTNFANWIPGERKKREAAARETESKPARSHSNHNGHAPRQPSSPRTAVIPKDRFANYQLPKRGGG